MLLNPPSPAPRPGLIGSPLEQVQQYHQNQSGAQQLYQQNMAEQARRQAEYQRRLAADQVGIEPYSLFFGRQTEDPSAGFELAPADVFPGSAAVKKGLLGAASAVPLLLGVTRKGDGSSLRQMRAKTDKPILDRFKQTDEVKVALSEISDSQLRKAESEGYDLSTIWYHGTPSPDGITGSIEKGNIKSSLYDQNPEPGFFITRDPAMAADYAGKNGVVEKIIIKYDSGRYYSDIPKPESEARSKENIVEFGLLDNDYSGEPTLQSSDAFIPFDLVDNSILLVKGSKLVKPK